MSFLTFQFKLKATISKYSNCYELMPMFNSEIFIISFVHLWTCVLSTTIAVYCTRNVLSLPRTEEI